VTLGEIRILFSRLSGCEKVGRKFRIVVEGNEWKDTNWDFLGRYSTLYVCFCFFLYVHPFFVVVVVVVSRYSQTSCII